MPAVESVLARELSRLRAELDVAANTVKATPMEAFRIASIKWIDGEKIEMNTLAKELGVGRATLFRWVGSKEQLLGEIIFSLWHELWLGALERAQGSGADYVTDACRLAMKGILAAEPLRHFLDQDAEYALRVLTSKTSVVQARVTGDFAKTLQEHIDTSRLRAPLDADNLGYAIIRMIESFVYSDQITGRKPDIDIPTEVIRLLVSGANAPPAVQN